MILEILIICIIIYLIYVLAIKSNFNSIDDNKIDETYEILNLEKPQIKYMNNIYNGNNVQPLLIHNKLLSQKFNVTSIVREIYFEKLNIYLVLSTVDDGIKYYIINKSNQIKEIYYYEDKVIKNPTKKKYEKQEQTLTKNFYPQELQNKIDMYATKYSDQKNLIQSTVFSVDSKRI